MTLLRLKIPDESWPIIAWHGSEQVNCLPTHRFTLIVPTCFETESWLYNKIIIEVQLRDFSVRTIEGYVIKIQTCSNRRREGRRVIIDVTSKLWFLTRTRVNRIFHNRKTLDLIDRLLRESNQHPLDRRCFLEKDRFNHSVTQYAESLFDFIVRLLNEMTTEFYCINNRIKLVSDRHRLSQYNKTLRVKNTGAMDEDYLFHWEQDIGTTSRVVAVGSIPKCDVGMRVQIEHEYIPECSGNYVVIGCEHRVENHAHQKHRQVFTLMPLENGSVNKSANYFSRRSNISGMQTANVIARAVKTDRVRVRFDTWLECSASYNRAHCNRKWVRSAWVPVQQFDINRGWGHRFLPVEGQSMQVMFVSGDPNQPVVMTAQQEAHSLSHQLKLQDSMRKRQWVLHSGRDVKMKTSGRYDCFVKQNKRCVVERGDYRVQGAGTYNVLAQTKIEWMSGESRLALYSDRIELVSDRIILN